MFIIGSATEDLFKIPPTQLVETPKPSGWGMP
jgi:hypothetical protein